MKVIKRNQLIVLVVSLMLITAGYLNFTANNNEERSTDTLADLGDAILVNNEVEEPVRGNTEEVEETSAEAEPENNEQEELSPDERQQYFVRSKLERDTMYSQMLATYQQMYNNQNSTAEQRSEAFSGIAEINRLRNSIMIAENLVKAQGIEDIVIFANNSSTSIVVRADELAPEQVAQIQNVVSRELGVEISDMRITTK